MEAMELTEANGQNRDATLKRLVKECTCPVCQCLLERPERLRCKHSLCHRCLVRLRHRAKRQGGLLCPVPNCREKSDPNQSTESDSTMETLVATLHIIKNSLCQESDCWRMPDVNCTVCRTIRCRQHHDSRLMELRAASDSICDKAEAFAANCSVSQKLHSLQVTKDSLGMLLKEMMARLEAKMDDCRCQLEQHKCTLAEQQAKCRPVLDDMKTKLEELRQLQATSNFAAMRQAECQLRELLATAKQLHPLSEISAPVGREECLRGLSGVLARVRVDPVVRPYGAGPGGAAAAQLARSLRTRPLQPWDLALLTNLDGVYLLADSLVQGHQTGCRRPEGGCLLLVNFKGFSTKRLHVLDSEAREVATVSLRLSSGEMPGKIAVCNRRQQILASEPSHHCVFVFSLSGALLKRFGRRGSEVGCFNEPMSLFPCEDTLYVVDSENKRVQLFNMTQDYAYMAKLEHPQFTGHVHSVHVGKECVVVSDRQCKRLFTFDRQSRQPLLDVGLEGQPFDMAADQFGNVFVSVTDGRTVLVFNHSLTVPLYTIRIPKSGPASVQAEGGVAAAAAAAAAAPQDDVSSAAATASSSDEATDPLRRLLSARRRKQSFIHGLALLPELRRLFVADTFRCRLLAFDLPT